MMKFLKTFRAVFCLMLLVGGVASAEVDSTIIYNVWTIGSAPQGYVHPQHTELQARAYLDRALPDSTLDTNGSANLTHNPTITFRVYMSHSENADPNGFQEVKSAQQKFIFGRYRLDREGVGIAMADVLAELQKGKTYAFYITADDGMGESAPSNVVTMALAPDPKQVFDAPYIKNAASQTEGEVVLKLDRLTIHGQSPGVVFYRVYRAVGLAAGYDDFELITVGNTGLTKYYIDSSGTGFRTSGSEIVISGLSAGLQSFYVTVQAPGTVESDPSNIVGVDVIGSGSEESITMRVRAASPSSVAQREAVEQAVVYPNPAGNVVHLRAPSVQGVSTYILTDTYGAVVRTGSVNPSAGVCTLSVSDLAAGSYSVLLRSGNTTSHARFNVVR